MQHLLTSLLLVQVSGVSWDVALKSMMKEQGVESVQCLTARTVLAFAWRGRNCQNPSQPLNHVPSESTCKS
jgi:hypothetical protein